MKKAPCKDCERRTVGCHADCADYIAWRKRAEEMKEIEKREKDLSHALNAIKEAGILQKRRSNYD